jgi:hypothetical protein
MEEITMMYWGNGMGGWGGGLVTAQSDFGGTFTPKIGDTVTVLFDPDRLNEVHIESRLSDRVDRLTRLIGWFIIDGAVIGIVVVILLYYFVW